MRFLPPFAHVQLLSITFCAASPRFLCKSSHTLQTLQIPANLSLFDIAKACLAPFNRRLVLQRIIHTHITSYMSNTVNRRREGGAERAAAAILPANVAALAQPQPAWLPPLCPGPPRLLRHVTALHQLGSRVLRIPCMTLLLALSQARWTFYGASIQYLYICMYVYKILQDNMQDLRITFGVGNKGDYSCTSTLCKTTYKNNML